MFFDSVILGWKQKLKWHFQNNFVWLSIAYQWLFHELRTILLKNYLISCHTIAEKIDFCVALDSTKKRNLKTFINLISAYGERCLFLPLRHTNVLSFTLWLHSRKQLPSYHPHHNHHHHHHLCVPRRKVGITRETPGMFKGLILKKKGINTVPD